MPEAIGSDETAVEFLEGLEAFVMHVRDLEHARVIAEMHYRRRCELEDQGLHYRAALHLVASSFLNTDTAEQRLDRISVIVSEAIAKYDIGAPPAGGEIPFPAVDDRPSAFTTFIDTADPTPPEESRG